MMFQNHDLQGQRIPQQDKGFVVPEQSRLECFNAK
jgi:hypothetical protein